VRIGGPFRLTGNEPDLSGWLWAQNNEHRIPLPKLILLGLFKMTKGDFRAGMFFNAIALGVLAIFMVLAARHLRGKTKFSDAFSRSPCFTSETGRTLPAWCCTYLKAGPP